MKSLLAVLYICFVFGPILNTVNGNPIEFEKQLNVSGADINGFVRILPGSYLGRGGCGLVYRGKLNGSIPVAVKFFDHEDEVSAQREYIMYTFLYAIDNPNVEKYGIPSLYYYAEWSNHTVMAITLCEGSLNDREDDFVFPINALIIFQQFVRQSKYIHSCGIRHDDIKGDNIMLRSYQSFLIDYNLSSDMNDDTHLCTYRYMPRRSHYTDEIRKPIDDWESFFYGMADVCGVTLKWFSGNEYNDLNEEELKRQYADAKRNSSEIIAEIKKIDSEPLKNAFMAFAEEIFKENAADFPNYDRIDKVIAAQIKRLKKPNEPAFFTWLKKEDIEDAYKHIQANPIPNIKTEIMDPKLFDFKYPRINFNYFNGFASAGSSQRH